MNLSGRLVDAFIALEETRRFSLAAERCNISAPAFSQMITRLETQVGVRLFDRDTRKVTLTAEGEVFAQGARRIAAEMRATLAEVQGRVGLSSGRVQIAAPPSLSSWWLPRRMARFRADHPGIALRLADVVSDRCLDMLRSGEVDIGINAQSGNPLEFDAVRLFQEGSWVVCPSDDALAGQSHVTLRQLRHRKFIQTARSGSVYQYLRHLVEHADFEDTGLEVTHLSTLGGLVRAGFGVSIVPEHAVGICLQKGVTAVPLQAEGTTRSIYLIRRRGHSLSSAADVFWQMLLGERDADRAATAPARKRRAS
ncbi:MAG: LysR family transcriptional regulator [Rhodoferax sp.]|nr:LysR family transcriptional regulator [Rhodoferax sp.]